jgi:hypothetical protein
MRDPGLGGRGTALAVPRHELVRQRVHARSSTEVMSKLSPIA